MKTFLQEISFKRIAFNFIFLSVMAGAIIFSFLNGMNKNLCSRDFSPGQFKEMKLDCSK